MYKGTSTFGLQKAFGQEDATLSNIGGKAKKSSISDETNRSHVRTHSYRLDWLKIMTHTRNVMQLTSDFTAVRYPLHFFTCGFRCARFLVWGHLHWRNDWGRLSASRHCGTGRCGRGSQKLRFQSRPKKLPKIHVQTVKRPKRRWGIF